MLLQQHQARDPSHISRRRRNCFRAAGQLGRKPIQCLIRQIFGKRASVPAEESNQANAQLLVSGPRFGTRRPQRFEQRV